MSERLTGSAGRAVAGSREAAARPGASQARLKHLQLAAMMVVRRLIPSEAPADDGEIAEPNASANRTFVAAGAESAHTTPSHLMLGTGGAFRVVLIADQGTSRAPRAQTELRHVLMRVLPGDIRILAEVPESIQLRIHAETPDPPTRQTLEWGAEEADRWSRFEITPLHLVAGVPRNGESDESVELVSYGVTSDFMRRSLEKEDV